MAVEGELQATTERDSVDEGEGRHLRCVQLVEHGMADPRDCQGLVAVDDLGKRGKVGACRQDERLSGERDRHDVVAGERSVESPVQLS